MRTTKEQPSGFLEVFEEEVTLRCAATILDAEVEVLVLDVEGMNVKVESLAVAERAGVLSVASLIDVRFESGGRQVRFRLPS